MFKLTSPAKFGRFLFPYLTLGRAVGTLGRRDLVTRSTASMEEPGVLRRCVMNAALKCGRSTLVSLAPVFFYFFFGLPEFLGWNVVILLMEEILHQLMGSLSHYLQGFIHQRGV